MIKIYLIGLIVTSIIIFSTCKNTNLEVKIVMCLTWPIFWLHFLYCLTK